MARYGKRLAGAAVIIPLIPVGVAAGYLIDGKPIKALEVQIEHFDEGSTTSASGWTTRVEMLDPNTGRQHVGELKQVGAPENFVDRIRFRTINRPNEITDPNDPEYWKDKV